MFYLGCDTQICTHNQIGVAFADDIEGPWVKFSGNPVVPGAKEQWGTGQCSQVSIDGKGQFELIYRCSDIAGTRWLRSECDFSDMARFRVGPAVEISVEGLAGGGAHVAHDPVRDLYYLAADSQWHPTVRCLRKTDVAILSGSDFRAGRGVWRVLATLDQSSTGLFGNHNSAMGRDPFGRIADPEHLLVVFSSADPTDIWSFRIHQATFSLRSG
jgi:hypothetical protein